MDIENFTLGSCIGPVIRSVKKLGVSSHACTGEDVVDVSRQPRLLTPTIHDQDNVPHRLQLNPPNSASMVELFQCVSFEIKANGKIWRVVHKEPHHLSEGRQRVAVPFFSAVLDAVVCLLHESDWNCVQVEIDAQEHVNTYEPRDETPSLRSVRMPIVGLDGQFKASRC
jgi:hypothetical protein